MKKILTNFYRYRYCCLVAVVLVAGALYFLAWSRQGKITKANYDKIEQGMTEAEVEEILGSGSDSSRRKVFVPAEGGVLPPPVRVNKYWDGPEGTIWVQFWVESGTGKVRDKHWFRQPSLWDEIKKRLGL
jgi:hypothetical protein